MSALLAPMSLDEATAKHTQLKSLGSVMTGLLLEMRDRKGYLALGFPTFEEYGEKEWGYTRTYINRLADFESIKESLSVPIGTKLKEGQVRSLNKVPAVDRDAIYQEALAKATKEGKELTAKAVEEAVAEHLEKLNQAQLTIDGLEQSVTDKAEKIADEKIEVQKAEMQQQLDALVAKTEQESQDAISALNLTIIRLNQEKNELIASNSSAQSLDELKKLNLDIKNAQFHLDNLSIQTVETQAALNKLEIESQESLDAKTANHALYGAVIAIHTDIEDHLKQIETLCYTDNDKTHCYYPLTEKTSNTFLEVARVLKRIANEFESIAEPKTSAESVEQDCIDGVDIHYEALQQFFRKWKDWKKTDEDFSAGSNDYDWWLSKLKEEKDPRINFMIAGFPLIWERYSLKIKADN